MKIIRDRLNLLIDKDYKEFKARVVSNIKEEKILGVRVPKIRELAKEIKNEEYIKDFLNELPHKYQEEYLLHALILSTYKDIDKLMYELDKFLPYVDNWEVTDVISPKIFKKYPDKVYKWIKKNIKSNNIYVVRFMVVSLLQFYLDDNYNCEELELVRQIKIDDYYIKMAIAWFYSFAIIKQYDTAIKVLEDKKLDKFIHNKTISKCIDSYRISKEEKEYLKSLKIK